MKRLSKFAWLPCLILVIWLIVNYSSKSAQKTVYLATSTELSNDPRPIADGGAKPARAANENRAAHDEIPVAESSWAKELRELKQLAAKNPDAALARVARMPDKHERKIAAGAVCGVVAEKDAAKAMTAAWNFEIGKFSHESSENTALETLAKQWAEADLMKAFVWASALPADDESRRDHVVKGIALAVAKVAPAEAARMVTERINPESSVQIDAAIGVLREWAARDYSGAVAWASLFPAGPLRERSLEELARAGSGEPRVEKKPN